MNIRTSPERVAWVTLFSSFGLLILLSCSTSLFIHWYVFSSATSLQTQVLVGRGTMGIRDINNRQDAVRESWNLGFNETITTDEIAQGSIQFVDSADGNRVIANAVLLAGSQVQVRSATRPRFSFSTESYQIHLSHFEGRLEIEVPPNLAKPLVLSVNGTYGQATIQESGLYLLWSLPETMTIIPRGNSVLFSPKNSRSVQIQSGQTATINAETRTLSISKTTDELVQNPLFNQALDPDLPDGWGCYETVERLDAIRPSSNFFISGGRRTLAFKRRGEGSGASEIGCRQYLGQDGLAVNEYRTLRLRITMAINWHSLAVCGFQGSECPVMVELTYLNEMGLLQRWIHGFYAFNHNDSIVPRICSSCLLEHDRITAGNWYTYETGNLFNLPEGFRPTKLLQVRFYTSGHEYDVKVAEFSLLAER